MNKITSFPHTLSLCSKKAESKVKRVKSYYCTRVCPKHAKCSNIHVWGAKVVQSGSGALSLRSTMDPERPYADTSSECRDVLNASKCAFREMNRKDLIQVVAVRS